GGTCRDFRSLPGECRAHATRQASCTIYALSACTSRPGGDRSGHRLGELGCLRSGRKPSAHSESYTRMAVGRRRGPLPDSERACLKKLFSLTPVGSILPSSFPGSRKT